MDWGKPNRWPPILYWGGLAAMLGVCLALAVAGWVLIP